MELVHVRDAIVGAAPPREFGVSTDELLDLGRTHPGDPSAPLEMAVLALRFAGSANGVSRLHGAVSRRLFASLFPLWPEREIPIGSVTNGVHVATWVSDAMRELWHLFQQAGTRSSAA